MAPTHKPLVSALTRRRDDERGVVLVLVALLMTVFMGMAAIAIDIGYFDQQHTQAQSAADAAALAGAAVLATSQSAATTNADSYVTKNMSTATPTVSFPSSGGVKVVLNLTVQSFFGHFLGVNSTNVSASATAKATGSSSLCATPGSTCYAIFAKDSSCTSGHYGIQFSGGGNTITGGILANGSVSPGGGGSSFGPSTYGPSASGCTWPTGSDTHVSGPTSESALITTWPIDYSTDFPACTGAACTGPGGTPSFCTQSSTSTSWSLNTVVSGNIYCGVGTGTAGTPSTWNGAIAVGAGGVGSSASPLAATYVAGSVALNGGGDYLAACGYSSTGYKVAACSSTVPTPTTPNYPLIYALGTSATAINGGGGGSFFFGDLFAPNGTITFNGGGDTTSFLEGNDVVYTGGGLIGDGPSTSGSILGTTGSVALIQ